MAGLTTFDVQLESFGDSMKYEFLSFLAGRNGAVAQGLHFVAPEVPLLRSVLWPQSLGIDAIPN